MKLLTCPHCESEKVRTTDNEPLFHPREEEVKKDNDVYGLDPEIYISAVCDGCGQKLQIVAELTVIKTNLV